MSLIALKFTPGAPSPEITVLKESIEQVQAAVGSGGLNAKTINILNCRMVLITSTAPNEPINRLFDGRPIHGTFLLCGDGKGASIVSIPLRLIGHMQHAAEKVFELPVGAEGGRIA